MKDYEFSATNEKQEKKIEKVQLEDKDFLLITAIDNLTKQLKILGNKYGR